MVGGVSRMPGRVEGGHSQARGPADRDKEGSPGFSMNYLLDTDTVSFALRGHGEVAARLKQRKPSELSMSAITLAELRFGADRKSSRRLHGLIDVFSAAVEVAPFDDAAAVEF